MQIPLQNIINKLKLSLMKLLDLKIRSPRDFDHFLIKRYLLIMVMVLARNHQRS